MQKRLCFGFRDAAGHEREGLSEPMPPDDAYDWNPGDAGEIRYDVANPDDQIWTGQRHGRCTGAGVF